MKRIPRCFLLLVACCLLSCLPSVSSAARDSGASHSEMAGRIAALLDTPELRPGFQGILIRSLKTEETLFEQNADRLFLPASNNKLLTAAAALEILGRDFAYRTRLYRTGPIGKDGVLRGDLVLQGAGDPWLFPAHLERLAQLARKAGIRRVEGSARADASRFDAVPLGDSWGWDDEPYYYSAQISALNLNQNLLYLHCLPGKRPGDPVRVLVGPTRRYARLINAATTGEKGGRTTLKIDRARGRNVITITGSLPVGIPARDNLPVGVTVEDPARYAAFVLREKLQAAGISVRGGVEVKPLLEAGTVVAEHRSPPLPELLRRMNKPSDNLTAECLLKTIGAVRSGQGTGGPNGTGAMAAREWFRKLGLDMTRLRMADGSGLSRMNYVSPRNLVHLLTEMRRRPDFALFYDSLPIAGVDGTLRNRMKGTPAAGNCRAKTGSLSFVSALSGYVTTRDGEMLAFSLLMNSHLAPARVVREAQDKIVALLAGYRRPQEPDAAATEQRQEGEARDRDGKRQP